MAGELQAAFHQRRPGGGKDSGTGASGLGGEITIEGPPVYNPPRDGKLFALAEAYPDLKANENFAELQRSLETIEGEIQMSRRYYNGAARDLNVKVESFPSNLIANAFRFVKAGYFEITNEADRAVPQVKF